MASSSSSPCAACKFLRRKCTTECVFAPYFPPDQPHKFANVHKIFGASNITKLLNELPPHQREDAVNSLAYEADARVKDPVYGCVGAISVLQRQVAQLQTELAMAHSDLARYAGAGMVPAVGPSGAGTGPSLGIGMGVGVAGSREPQHMITRDQLMELAREPPFTREQLMELARAGGSGAAAAAGAAIATSYEPGAGAGVGLASHRQLGGGGSYHATRAGSDGNSGGSGGAGTSSMGHLSSA